MKIDFGSLSGKFGKLVDPPGVERQATREVPANALQIERLLTVDPQVDAMVVEDPGEHLPVVRAEEVLDENLVRDVILESLSPIRIHGLPAKPFDGLLG